MKYLISEIFAFNWHRFTYPGVIAGLCILAVGMAVLIASNAITKKINAARVKMGKKKIVNIKFMLYGVSAVLVLVGGLLAIFMAG